MSVILHHGNCLQIIKKIGQCDMIFADVFDNINLKYKGFDDKMPDDDYENFLSDVIMAMYDHAPISWMSFNAKWFAMVGDIVHWYNPANYRFFIQTFTFGQNQRKDFVNGYRPILRMMHDGAETFPDAVRVESWRQKNGDKRACSEGKVPDDVWAYPRVTGNSKQRRSWSPTQLHEGIYERAINFSTRPGARICDMFAGSGTMGRVAEETHEVHLIELSDETFEHLKEEFK